MILVKAIMALSLFAITTKIAYGNDIFLDVKNKFEKDQKSLKQFEYLGMLHCLDNRIGMEDEKLFVKEYIHFYNGLFPLSRLLKEKSLDKHYTKFENQKLPQKRDEIENSIIICQDLYNSTRVNDLYLEVISNKNNYYQENDEIMFSKEDIEQNMLDYLNIGRIDRCRFLDCIPEKGRKQ